MRLVFYITHNVRLMDGRESTFKAQKNKTIGRQALSVHPAALLLDWVGALGILQKGWQDIMDILASRTNFWLVLQKVRIA